MSEVGVGRNFFFEEIESFFLFNLNFYFNLKENVGTNEGKLTKREIKQSQVKGFF